MWALDPCAIWLEIEQCDAGGDKTEAPVKVTNGFMTKAYPDYPPPSFLEATSVPVSSSNATFVALSQSVSPIAPTGLSSTLPMTSPVQTLMSPPSSTLSSGNDFDSDTSSLEIIDMDSLPVEGQLPSGLKLEENIRRDWLNRRGVEFPSPPESQVRGRSKNRSRAILDSDSEDGTEETLYALRQTSQKNKNLSPLRTLFPYRAMTVEQPLSASPNSSPYSSRSSLPFLSATSLKMPGSTTSISSVKGEGFFSRRFLSFKGKERAKESLDVWEIVEKQPDLHSDNISSPTRSQSFTSGMPVHPVVKGQAPPTPPTPIVTTSATAPHPLSLRDRKPPPVPFVTRPKKKTPPPPPKPISLVSVPQGPILVSVRTRIPPPPPRKSVHLASSPLVHDSWCPSNLDSDTESNSILQRAIITPLPVSPIEGGSPTTPVLSSPTESISVSACASSPTSPTVLDHQTPKWENDITAQDRPSDLCLSATRVLPSPAEDKSTARALTPTSPTEHDHQISTRESNTIVRDTPSDRRGTPGDHPDDDEPQSPVSVHAPSPVGDPLPATRHHYAGRPLPQPPDVTRSSLDSAHGTTTHDEPRVQQSSQCPEGLLIDLDDSSVARTSISSLATPRIHGGESNLVTPSYATSSSSSVDLLGSIADMEMPVIAQHSHSQVDPNPALPAEANSQPISFSDITDLDALVSQISEEERRDGSDYDVSPSFPTQTMYASSLINDFQALLLLSEFIGPASPPRRSAHLAPVSGNPPRQAQSNVLPSERTPAPNVPLLGNVRLERRRTTKDGRVKLKLGLLDAAVDKCGICLTQFRSGDAAQLGSACRHAFHEKCLGRWLVRSKTCPMCRVPLVPERVASL
ncbi:hypothetical protein C0995_011261 [Termitomyces sp. Mi166|nr:hypothetical protein C0995_011261 [Termitomyces sp. Mi166\